MSTKFADNALAKSQLREGSRYAPLQDQIDKRVSFSATEGMSAGEYAAIVVKETLKDDVPDELLAGGRAEYYRDMGMVDRETRERNLGEGYGLVGWTPE